MTSDLVLEVARLHAGYGRTTVLHGVDLTVPANTAVGLAGLNGAGKSTLLRALSGTAWHHATTLQSCGQTLPRSPHGRAVAGLAHVPEGRRVFAGLTVNDNLLYGAAAVGGPKRQAGEDLARVLDLFPPLRTLAGRRAGQLSGGEQQMLAIGRGLMARPRLLMIDEMTLGLSPRASADIAAVLTTLRSEEHMSLLLVDQNIDMLAACCDTVYVLSDGTLKPSSTEAAQLGRSYF
ncbi:ATP-binding cassette domain-containing protein [Intrasporangium sp. DVR]|uniref:ABC transporter ATP-binding protein n=1 Tax=Intrasporangium sp. DVR TaxID=3127867 RepID=UPI00313A5587